MQEAPIVARRYAGTDTNMLHEARVNHTLSLADLAAFTLFDGSITAAWMSAWLVDIVGGETIAADTAIIDQQAQTTDTAGDALSNARNKYSEVKYFITKPPAMTEAMQGEFGVNDYSEARRNRLKMAKFMEEMHHAAVKYKVQLIARGYTQAKIDGIQTVRQSLLSANTYRDVFRKGRPKLTEDRILLLNRAYDKLTQLNAAAQMVYMNDAAKRAQFVFDPYGDTDDFSEHTGTVAASETRSIADVPYAAAREITFQNTGIAPLEFFLSADGTNPGTGGVVAIGGGAAIVKRMDELDTEGTKLMVKNIDATQEGAYEVEVEND